MRRLLSCVFIFISISVLGQDNPKIIGLRGHYGIIIPHYEELKPISSSRPWGIQLDYSWMMIRKKSWNNCNCFAQVGFSFEYFNYQNPEELGRSYNFIYFAEPYFNYKNDLFFSFRAGVGATLLDQVYDEEENPENVFYSSTLSFLLLLNLNVNYRLNDQYFLSLSTNYNHISNGGMKKPNKGMNFPTVSLGVNYSPKDFDFPKYEKNVSRKGRFFGYSRLFFTFPGVSEGDGFEEERKLLIGLSGGTYYHVTQLNAFNAGLEIIRDGAFKESSERQGNNNGYYVLGATIGHNLIFGRWTFNQQMGFYVYKPENYREENFFQRYELLYQIGSRWQIGTSLKAHGHVADNLDLRFGILF